MIIGEYNVLWQSTGYQIGFPVLFKKRTYRKWFGLGKEAEQYVEVSFDSFKLHKTINRINQMTEADVKAWFLDAIREYESTSVVPTSPIANAHRLDR